MTVKYRVEHDSLGEVKVPEKAYWGAQTQRAVENFPVSGHTAHRGFIWASGAVKLAAAMTHRDLGLLYEEISEAIIKSARELMEGKWDSQFVVDVYQAGAGTSHNMNINEVIANRALEILGLPKGNYKTIHPNDHINMGQSTNDVIPTALRLFFLKDSVSLIETLYETETGFRYKAKEFDGILKSGRTHLQDAVPIRLGQEFSAYAEIVKRSRQRISEARKHLMEIGLGGSAAGTGLNVHPEYRQKVAYNLMKVTGFDIKPAHDYFWAMQSLGPLNDFSASLNNAAIEISKIMNDLRLLASGPTTGLFEIILPPVQPGSSIMPGKVNPVLPEMMNMVCFSVMGYHQSVMWAAAAGQLELNVMMPILAFSVGEMLKIMTNGLKAFNSKALIGIKANEAQCRYFLEKSPGLATALNPIIGYEKAAEVAKEAFKSGRSIKEVILEKGYLSGEEMERILAPGKLTKPGIPSLEDKEEISE